jgi:hypothetical protein
MLPLWQAMLADGAVVATVRASTLPEARRQAQLRLSSSYYLSDWVDGGSQIYLVSPSQRPLPLPA